MVATEKRMGSSRRGMTVLGKIPVAPKPINLPSQRLENQGLLSDVDIVPRGTRGWGTVGGLPAITNGKVDPASLCTANSDRAQENGPKVESKSVPSPVSNVVGGKDEGGLLKNGTAPTGSGASPVVTGQNTTEALDSHAKMEDSRNSLNLSLGQADGQKPETEKISDLPPQQSGYVHSGGGSDPQRFGDYGPNCNFSRSGARFTDFQSNGLRQGMYSDSARLNAFHSFPGMPYHCSNTKDREIIIVHMFGNPGFYGGYPPQFGYVDNYNRIGMQANFPLQFGNFEPYFGLPGHHMLDGGQFSAISNSEIFDEHEGFVCYEKECYKGACHELGRHKNGRMHGTYRETTFLSGAQRDVQEALMSNSFSAVTSRSNVQRHMFKNAGKAKSAYRNGRAVSKETSSAEPVPEKRITLLTKVSQHELLVKRTQEGNGIKDVAHAQDSVSPVFPAVLSTKVCEADKGECLSPRAPMETSDGKANEEPEIKKSESAAVSQSGEMAHEIIVPCENDTVVVGEAQVVKKTCNEECVHCKAEAAALEGSTISVCQTSKISTINESTLTCFLKPTEDLPVRSIEKANSVDGCKVEVKHVIFDADSCSMNAKGQEAASPKRSASVILDSSELENSLDKNCKEQKEKQRSSGKRSIISRKWKHKWQARAAKVEHKVFAPKIQKVLAKKKVSKPPANEKVSIGMSLPSVSCYQTLDSDKFGDNLSTMSSQTATCIESEGKSSSSSSTLVVGDSATSLDFIGLSRKAELKSISENIPSGDCHDNIAAGCPIEGQESSIKTVIEGTVGEKTKSINVYNTSVKTWKPKVHSVSEAKSKTNAAAIQLSKAVVVHGFQKRHFQAAVVSTDHKNSSEMAAEVNVTSDKPKMFKRKSLQKLSHQIELSKAPDEIHASVSTSSTFVMGTKSNEMAEAGDKVKEVQTKDGLLYQRNAIFLKTTGKQKVQQQQATGSKRQQYKQAQKGGQMGEGQPSPVHGKVFAASSSQKGSVQTPEDPEEAVQSNTSPSKSQGSNMKALQNRGNQSNKAASIPARDVDQGHANLFANAIAAEKQADFGHKSNSKQPIVSSTPSLEVNFGLEHTKHGHVSDNSLKDANSSVSASKYHIIRRRVYHVVEGCEGDYDYLTPTPQNTQNCESYEISNVQQQRQSKAKHMSLAKAHVEQSEDLVTLPDCTFGKAGESCKEGVPKEIRHNQALDEAGMMNIKKSKKTKATKNPLIFFDDNAHQRPRERVFRKYKETGQWKPKADLHKSVTESIENKPAVLADSESLTDEAGSHGH